MEIELVEQFVGISFAATAILFAVFLFLITDDRPAKSAAPAIAVAFFMSLSLNIALTIYLSVLSGV